MTSDNNQTNKKQIITYTLCAISGALVFILIYGLNVLNPVYIDWLLSSGDRNIHYLGWKAVRDTAQSFPILMQDRLAYPNRTSIIFTDSLPLMALIFRPFSAFLPDHFQYFGFWGIVCFIVQAVLMARIIQKYTDDIAIAVIASFLIVLTPVMIFRMFIHTALAGQWIIILGLLPLFDPDYYVNNKYALYKHFILLGALCALVHLYFAFMNAFIWLGICVYDFIKRKDIKRVFISALCYAGSIAFALGIIGGFSSNKTAESMGVGTYSFNLNGFFNPQGWSDLLPDLPLYHSDQYEGFAYLGLGGIVVGVLALLIVLFSKRGRSALKNNVALLIGFIITFVFSIIAAISPVVTFNDKLLVDMHLPESVNKLWGIIRSSGRLSWVGVYMIVICGVVIICKFCDKRVAIGILGVCLLLQVYDLHSELYRRHTQSAKTITYTSPLSAYTFWEEIASNDEIKRICLTDFSEYYPEMFVFGNWAADNGKTLNTIYAARSKAENLEEAEKNLFNDPSKEDIYVFFERNILKCKQYDLHYYLIGEFLLGYVNEIPGYEEYDPQNASMMWAFGGNKYLSADGGLDGGEGRTLYPGGLSYGPYCYVPKGERSITVDTDDIDALEVHIVSDMGSKEYECEMEEKSGKVIFNLMLEDSVEDMEISIRNISDHEVLIKTVEIR